MSIEPRRDLSKSGFQLQPSGKYGISNKAIKVKWTKFPQLIKSNGKAIKIE